MKKINQGKKQELIEQVVELLGESASPCSVIIFTDKGEGEVTVSVNFWDAKPNEVPCPVDYMALNVMQKMQAED